MKALVYHGPGRKSLDERPMPELAAPTDVIVRVTRTTICGTDLHILKGDVPSCEPGRVLGHEGVGVVHRAGGAVSTFKEGDRVLISCISSCGQCEYCRRGMYSHCATGGWILGNRIDGTQAEYVRIPHAQTSLYRIAPGADEEALVMLSDILPTGFECGVLNGRVQPGGDAEARQEARGSGRGPRVITRQLTVDRPLAIRRHSLPSGSRRPPTAGRRPKSRRGRRAPRHAVSISFACLRVVAVISRPPSIRATSSIRLARSSGTTVDTVPPSPSSPFAT